MHTNSRMIRRGARAMYALSFVLAVSACSDALDWMDGAPPVVKRTPGERVNVVPSDLGLKADDALQNEEVQVPEQSNLTQWYSMNDAMQTPHVGLTGVTHEQTASVGDGNGFARTVVSGPLVADGRVYAMDAAGIVSAHNEADISEILWVDATGRPKRVNDVLGGGLALADGVLYATNGSGNLRAIEAASGTVKWTISVGAPVRGAPAVADGLVLVLTADNQTLAYDAMNGQPRWNHRGISEAAGYFSITSPVIRDGIVVAAYSSGEVFALRLETGAVLWSDTLAGGVRTKAAAAFGGIDANPIVQDGVVVVASTSGQMQASALINGRPLWQQRIGVHSTPWSAGNVLYVLSDTHDIAAIMKRDGTVRWATSMAVKDKNDLTKDITPPLYGPILSANAILVIDGNGVLTSFKPTDGTLISTYQLADGIVTNPVIANGAMYVLTKAGKLVKYY